MNTKKIALTIQVMFVVLCLSACGMLPDTFEPITDLDLPEILEPKPDAEVLADCFVSFQVAAWQDLNGDGVWDESEPPLEGVTFNLQGLFAEKWAPEPSSKERVGSQHLDLGTG